MKRFEQRELIKKNKITLINKSSTRREKKFSTIVFKFVDVFMQSFLINIVTLINTIISINIIIAVVLKSKLCLMIDNKIIEKLIS